MGITNRKLALALARECGITEPSTQKLEQFFTSCRNAVIEELALWVEPQRNDIPATGKEFAAALRALKSQPADDRIAQMERDAARLDWLQERHADGGMNWHVRNEFNDPVGTDLRKEIDAAMQSESPSSHCGQDTRGDR